MFNFEFWKIDYDHDTGFERLVRVILVFCIIVEIANQLSFEVTILQFGKIVFLIWTAFVTE